MWNNMAHMLPTELEEYLEQGGDLAILSCGSVEQHGPHQLLGTDSYLTQMLADYTAEYSGGISIPMAPFSWIGGLRVWPGTIDIRSKNQGDYLENLCLSLIDMGFRRLLIINGHGGGREIVFSAARRVFRQTGVHVMAIFTSGFMRIPEIRKLWAENGVTDHASHEAAESTGGMIHIGRPDLAEEMLASIDEILAHGGEYEEPVMPPQQFLLYKLGETGHDYLEERRHSQPRYNTNPQAGIAVTKACAKYLAKTLEKYADYNQEIENELLEMFGDDEE